MGLSNKWYEKWDSRIKLVSQDNKILFTTHSHDRKTGCKSLMQSETVLSTYDFAEVLMYKLSLPQHSMRLT